MLWWTGAAMGRNIMRKRPASTRKPAAKRVNVRRVSVLTAHIRPAMSRQTADTTLGCSQ